MVEAFETLMSENKIFAGSLLDKDTLERVLDTKVDSYNFWSRKLNLKNRIELDGFFLTERDCADGEMRILRSDEMADYGNQKLVRSMNSNFKVALIMRAHDTSSLSEKQKKEHDFIRNKAATCAIAMKSELIENDSF